MTEGPIKRNPEKSVDTPAGLDFRFIFPPLVWELLALMVIQLFDACAFKIDRGDYLNLAVIWPRISFVLHIYLSL